MRTSGTHGGKNDWVCMMMGGNPKQVPDHGRIWKQSNIHGILGGLGLPPPLSSRAFGSSLQRSLDSPVVTLLHFTQFLG